MLVYMYYTHPSYRTSIVGKNCVYHIRIFMIPKILAYSEWGADQSTLLHVHRSLIHSKLDYGSVVYGSARTLYLNLLNPVANQLSLMVLSRSFPYTSNQ